MEITALMAISRKRKDLNEVSWQLAWACSCGLNILVYPKGRSACLCPGCPETQGQRGQRSTLDMLKCWGSITPSVPTTHPAPPEVWETSSVDQGDQRGFSKVGR